MIYYAHSPKDGYPAQLYKAHIMAVVEKALKHAEAAALYAKHDGQLFLQHAEATARYHDMGKLESENQKVLSGKKKARTLPYHHQDAGTARFMFPSSPSVPGTGRNPQSPCISGAKTCSMLNIV